MTKKQLLSDLSFVFFVSLIINLLYAHCFSFFLLFRTPVLQAELLEGQFQCAAQIGAYVLDPTSKVVYQKQSSMEGHWAFTSPADGSYKVCISNPNSKLKQSVGMLWRY